MNRVGTGSGVEKMEVRYGWPTTIVVIANVIVTERLEVQECESIECGLVRCNKPGPPLRERQGTENNDERVRTLSCVR